MPAFDRAIETLIFASRWILAPFFLGLLVAMVVLLFKFMKELYEGVGGPCFQHLDDLGL